MSRFYGSLCMFETLRLVSPGAVTDGVTLFTLKSDDLVPQNWWPF